MDPIILFVIGLVIMMLIFYLTVRFITGDDLFDATYFFRILLASVIVIFIAPFFQSLTSNTVLGPISTIVAFVIILYAVRFLLVEPLTSSEAWEKTIWISLLAVSAVYVLNAGTMHFLDTSIVPNPF